MAETIGGRHVLVFLALTIALSAIFWAFAITTGNHVGGHGFYATGLMWSPGAAALLTCRICGIPIGSLGWGWGRGRWQAIAYLTPLIYATIAYLLVWAIGLGGVPSDAFLAKTRQSMSWTGAPDAVVILGWLLFLGTVGMTASLGNALGEEIGWRGFLVPRLTARFGFTGGALTTGAIMALWHLPVLVFSDYNEGTPWWYGLLCFTVLVLAANVIWSWLRLRSGSLWTGTVFHASHNLFIQGFFTPVTAPRGPITVYAIDEFGFMLPIIVTIVAIGFWLRRREAMAGAVA